MSSLPDELQKWIDGEVVRMAKAWPHRVMQVAYSLSVQYNQAHSDAGVSRIDVQSGTIVVLLRADATVRQVNDWAMRLQIMSAEPMPDHPEWAQSVGRYSDVVTYLVLPTAATNTDNPKETTR